MWDLVARPQSMNVIGTKWIYKNKSDENGTVTRKEARLVAQGLNLMESGGWLYLGKVLAP